MTDAGKPIPQNAVALFSAYYPSHGGGMELASAELAEGLVRSGFQVEWVAQADRTAWDGLADQRVRLTPLPGTDFVYALSGVPMPMPMPWALPAIFRTAKNASVVVIAEANFILSFIAFVAAKLHRKPILLVQHVGEPSTVSRLARWIMRLGEQMIVRPMVRNADAFVCVSPVVARHFAEVTTKSGCIVIGHGVDMGCFRLSSNAAEHAADRELLGLGANAKVCSFIGRLTESKGVLVFAEMARLRPEWIFVIAGIGPVDPDGWQLPNVRALGQLDRSEVARLYRVSDFTALPSQSESFSLVVREALACGSGVICADQILETDPGLAPYIMTARVDLSDVAATARLFAATLDNPARAPSNQARDYVAQQCSWDAVIARYVTLIKELLNGTSAQMTARKA